MHTLSLSEDEGENARFTLDKVSRGLGTLTLDGLGRRVVGPADALSNIKGLALGLRSDGSNAVGADKGVAGGRGVDDLGLLRGDELGGALLVDVVDAPAAEGDDDVLDLLGDEPLADALQPLGGVEVGLLAAGEDGGLGLVDDEVGESVVGLLGEALGGGGVQEDGYGGGLCGAQGGQDGVGLGLEGLGKGAELVGGDGVVGFRGEDDAVLSGGLVDNDDGHAGLEVVADSDAVGADAVLAEVLQEERAVRVGADGADHGDGGGFGGGIVRRLTGPGELRTGDGLVCALATGGDDDRVRRQGLAWQGVVRDVRRQVDVEGAEDGDLRSHFG
ncbi:ribokinase [Colletotrichum asianum]